MGFYERHVLPRLLDLALRSKEATRYRSHIVPRARAAVLEVGIGSGLNLPFYGPQVSRLVGVDSSAELLQMARRRAAAATGPVELVTHGGEALPLPDRSFDTVVFTFTLCSVGDPLAVLREARRVLKPGGELLFAEHGLAPDPIVQRWQRRLNPAWRRMAGGCNLDRPIDTLIAAAGFRIGDLATGYAKGPRPMSYIYAGAAEPT
jgi:ubiquinone/menaquinone biosynthesis C-methylase UbiE